MNMYHGWSPSVSINKIKIQLPRCDKEVSYVLITCFHRHMQHTLVKLIRGLQHFFAVLFDEGLNLGKVALLDDFK